MTYGSQGTCFNVTYWISTNSDGIQHTLSSQLFISESTAHISSTSVFIFWTWQVDTIRELNSSHSRHPCPKLFTEQLSVNKCQIKTSQCNYYQLLSAWTSKSGQCRHDTQPSSMAQHITPVLEDLHRPPVSQQVAFKTGPMVWKCVMVSLQLISVTSAYPLLPSQVVSICDLQWLALYWFLAPRLQLDNEV